MTPCPLPEHLAAIMREDGKAECACWRWFKPEAGLTTCESCDPEGWASILERRKLESATWMLHVYYHVGMGTPAWRERARELLVGAGVDPDREPARSTP